MTNTQFIQNAAPTHFGIDPEDLAEIIEFDHVCPAQWPIYVMRKEGQPVAWWDESANVAAIVR